MVKQSLDGLAIGAQKGCHEAKRELLRHYIPVVEKLSTKIWYLIDDVDAFETYCYQKIDDAVKRFDPARGSFYWQVEYRLIQAKNHFLNTRGKRRRALNLVPLSTTANETDDGPVDCIDILANVEQSVLAKEIVALLAKGDRRRMMILRAWIDGCMNDSQLSLLLAQQLGGKPDSHRQAIKRFRSECQTVLPQIA